MSFLLVDTGRYQQDQILSTLKDTFNAPTKLAGSLSDAMAYLLTKPKNLSCVIFNTEELRETMIPILKYLDEHSPLTSTLLLTSRKVRSSVADLADEYPQLDHYCFKPIHLNRLIREMLVAYEKRVEKNNTVLLFSTNPFRDLLPDVNVVRLEQFDKNIFKKPFRGLFIDSTTLSLDDATRLKKMLKSVVLPIALYGTETESAWLLNDISTVIYKANEPITTAIHRFAESSAHFLLKVLLTRQLKNASNEKRFREALSLSERLADIEPHSSLPHTFAGSALEQLNRHKAAIESYRRAIELNPFYPENYLRLIEMLPEDSDIRAQAKQYCPNHPEIKRLGER